MKKIVCILLCLCMLISLAYIPAYAAEDEATNEKTMEMFGFKPDPASFRTDALRPGTHPIDPKYDLLISDGSKTFKSDANLQKRQTLVNLSAIRYRFTPRLNIAEAFTDNKSTPYVATTTFAATSTGVKDHIAKIYFPNGQQAGYISLDIYDAEGNVLLEGYTTQGGIYTETPIEMWEVEGLLSLTAGDFDGDGVDELAVYTPYNIMEYLNIGTKRNDVSVRILEFDAENKTIEEKEKLDITPSLEAIRYSSYNGKFYFYNLPYLALCAEDFNNDGYDDLAITVNFSTWFRGKTGANTYSTTELLNPEAAFASLLEVFEGSPNCEFNWAIKHKVMVTEGLTGGSSNSDTKNRFILRNANITVGDVTSEGSKEIIIAGNYTRASVQNQTSTSRVTDNRYVEVDGEHALCHIVGYTTYDNLKRNEMYNMNTDYHWTIRKEGNDWTYCFNELADDSGALPVSLCAYKHKGTGHPDTIFVGGQFFDYNSETGTLDFSSNYDNEDLMKDSNGSSNVWIGQAVAGNLTNDMFGREIIAFPYYYKVSGKNNFNCIILMKSEETFDYKDDAPVFLCKDVFLDSSTHRLASVALLGDNENTSYITYDGNNTDVYYSDVEVLAIMQAPPLYGELNDGDYMGNSATSFAKSKGSAEGIAHGGALTAGVVVGFEQETSFLGLFKCAGAEYELSITGTVSYEKSTETTYNYTSGFSTTGTTDTAVVFTVPYVRYNCFMYVPEYTLPTYDEYRELYRFGDELEKNVERYIESGGEEQTNGTYKNGCEYYKYKYHSKVTSSNFQDQQAILSNVLQEIDFIEKAIVNLGEGGIYQWGEVVEGAILPYHYNIPQQPMVTTVDVSTYDAIADVTPGLEKIYGNVFHEGYSAGDPNSYAHSISNLNAVDEVLQSKQSLGGSEDGFLTNSNISAAGSSQSQSISVEKATSSTLGWGAAIENTSTVNIGGAKAGFTVSAEYNGSSVKTTTEGNEYEGEVVALPDNATADYSYAWKLVAYNAKLNGGKVPVVGYLTKMVATPPPSIPEEINIDNITDKSVTLSWVDGSRPASYYKLSRVYPSGSSEIILPVDNHITSTDGKYSYTVTNLGSKEVAEFIIEAYDANGKKSVPTDKITVLTFPQSFAASLAIDGIDESVLYRNGKILNITSTLTGTNIPNPFYKWEMDYGKGWEELEGKNSNTLAVEANPLYNQNRFRLSAIFIADGNAYTVYSNPLTINCATTAQGHNIDWDKDENSVTVTYSGEGTPANVIVKTGDTYKIGNISADGVEIDIKDAVKNNEQVRLFMWTNGLKPISAPFER